MPVKITSGTVNNSQRLINTDDLIKMKNDFIEQTTLSRKILSCLK